MQQPAFQTWSFRPSALAYAISVCVLLSCLLSTPVQANCVVTGNNLNCNHTSGTPGTPYALSNNPSINELNANINGTWGYTGPGPYLLSIQSFTGNSTINLNGTITWGSINFNSSDGTAGVLNIGNLSSFSNTGFNLNIGNNAKLELDLLNAIHSPGINLYAITAVTGPGQGINLVNDGTVSMKNSTLTRTGLILTQATGSDTSITNRGYVTYTGLLQAAPYAAGVLVASIGNNTININNEKEISVSTISAPAGQKALTR